MAKKVKKIVMKGLLKKIEPITTEVEIDPNIFGVDKLTVRSNLNMGDAFNFVRLIVDTCIGGENMEYNPEYFEFAVRLYTMYYYADVDMTKDIQGAYYALFGTDIYDKVFNEIDVEQYTDLRLSAENQVEYMKRISIESIGSKVNDVMNGLASLLEGSDELSRVLSDGEFKAAVERLAGSEIGQAIMSENVDGNNEMLEAKERLSKLPVMTEDDAERIRQMVRDMSKMKET